MEYSRSIVLDRKTGQILKLADLFQPEENYVFPISREIEAQMAERMNADEECFRPIDSDQSFYINAGGKLVIVFAAYEIAPGYVGTPEFIISADVLDGLLAQPLQ